MSLFINIFEKNMEGEVDYDEKPTTLFQSFPNYDESAYSCLTLWPSLEAQTGSFYHDLFDSSSKDPMVPSALNSDPAMKLLAEMRSLLAHILILKNSGSLEAQGHENQVIFQLIYKYADLNKQFAAYLIQRFWRSKNAKGKAQKEAKLAYNRIFIGRPNNASTPQEQEIRSKMISDIMESVPESFYNFQ